MVSTLWIYLFMRKRWLLLKALAWVRITFSDRELNFSAGVFFVLMLLVLWSFFIPQNPQVKIIRCAIICIKPVEPPRGVAYLTHTSFWYVYKLTDLQTTGRAFWHLCWFSIATLIKPRQAILTPLFIQYRHLVDASLVWIYMTLEMPKYQSKKGIFQQQFCFGNFTFNCFHIIFAPALAWAT